MARLRHVTTLTVLVALHLALATTVILMMLAYASPVQAQPGLVTHPVDVALIEAIITNYPTSWGTLSYWDIGNDPCTGGRVTNIGGVTCEVIDGYYRVTQFLLAGYGLPFANRTLSGPIPPQVGMFPYMHVLSLRNNNFTGELPPLVSTSLTSIDFSNNSLTGIIPESYFNQPDMAKLDLTGNFLTGTLPAEILGCPWSVRLANNRLTGPLNMRINTTRLTSLDLSSNQLSGQLPDLEGAVDLQVFHLNNNKLTGTIPNSIAALPKLIRLSLGNNQLSGSIPTFDSPWLVSLDLSQNRLTGPIPLTFDHNQMLSALVLSCNRLTGLVPANLANLPSLQFLRLEVNELSGDLPEFLQSPPIVGARLRAAAQPKLNFNASCNDFYGPLPAWCGTFGDRTCTPCADEQRVCVENIYIAEPITPSPSPPPSDDDDDSSANTLGWGGPLSRYPLHSIAVSAMDTVASVLLDTFFYKW